MKFRAASFLKSNQKVRIELIDFLEPNIDLLEPKIDFLGRKIEFMWPQIDFLGSKLSSRDP